MITQVLTFCTIISVLNGVNGQTLSGPSPDGMYVFDLPPLQVQPLQIRLMPSQSSLFLVRQNDKSEMELVPIQHFEPKDTLSRVPQFNNQNQIPSVNTAVPKPAQQIAPQPLPQVTAQAVPQSSTQAKTQFPKESSVTYDVPTIESVLKELSLYKPYELPPQSLLYKSVPQSARTEQLSAQSLTPSAPNQNTRYLPAITLPAVTLQSENGPIQTIAVELPPQILPFRDFIYPQTLTSQTPTPPTETTPLPTTIAQPLPTDSVTAQTIKTETLPVEVEALPTQEVTAKPNQKVVDIRTFAERSKLSSRPLFESLKPLEPLVKPTVQPIISSSNQKPIITSINRMQGLFAAPVPVQPLQLQTSNKPLITFAQNKAQLEPYKFGFAFTDSLGNQQSRKEEISPNGVITGNYKYIDANGISRHVEYIADENGFRAGIGTNEPGTIGRSSAGVKVNAQLIKPTKKPIILSTNNSNRKYYFTQN